MYESDDDTRNDSSEKSNLQHNRSQSLIDMSIFSKEKNSKWISMVENRKKSLSKLKGLVIPEQNETDVPSNVNVAIPEIKSYTTVTVPVPKIDSNININPFVSKEIIEKPTISIPSWSSNATVPKYSPAFKRKSLQIYPTLKTNIQELSYNNNIANKLNKSTDDDLNPPKSLESISSPTRSDCSFDYVSSIKKSQKELENHDSSFPFKTEDESDNDSAVSSSQSSYNSRYSPPPSPVKSELLENGQNRMLKPFSVEAINRKNILASAKCRSGRDIKIGSPVVQRKIEEEKLPFVPKKTEPNDVVDSRVDCTKVENEKETKCTESTDSKTASVTPTVKAEVHNGNSNNDRIQVARNTLKPPPSQISLLTKLKPVQETKENKPLDLDKFSASSILAKRNKPVNVKALKQNFENIGSANSTPTKSPNNKIEKPGCVKNRISNIQKTAEIKKVVPDRTDKVEKRDVKVNNIPNPTDRLSLGKTDTEPIELNLDEIGGSLGITLAGGSDYEVKAITIYRIRFGSVAYKDGRLKKGDKVLSINGKSTSGLTHEAAVELLKESCKKFVIEIEKYNEPTKSRVLSPKAEKTTTDSKCPLLDTLNTISKQPTKTVSLIKDGAGLGFSIEGGKDSPNGDVPLLIKKIFTGGAADKCGDLQVGDEIIFINDQNFTNLTRIEAWSLMKKLPDGPVKIQVYR